MSNNPFLADSVLAFGDVIVRLNGDPKIPDERRKSLTSSLMRTVGWAAQSSRSMLLPTADTLAFTSETVKELFRSFVPAKLGKRGVSTKSLDNAQSDCRFVLRLYGLAGKPEWAPFSPEVERLNTLLDGNYLQLQLKRCFCYMSSVGETEFSEAVSAGFHEASKADPSVRDPDKLRTMTARGWNKAAATVPGWPQSRILVPRTRKPWGKPWSNYPRLNEEAVAFLNQTRRHAGLFSKQIKTPLLRPATITNQLELVRILASELELSGVAPDKITGLRALVEPGNFKVILQSAAARAGGQVNHLVHLKSMVLVKIARKANVLDADELALVESAYEELRVEYKEFKKIHVERSHALIEAFDDPRVMDALIELPDKIEAEVKKATKITRPIACRMKCAVILAIWLEAPLRSLNIRSLIFERHLFPALLDGEETLRISIPATEVKNAEPLDHLLSPEVAGMIRRYMTKYRPKLLLSPSEYLFPGLDGAVIATQTLRTQMRRLIEKPLRTQFTPHLIRNLVTKLVLDEDPNAIQTACSQLGHKNDDMVRRVYKQRRSRVAQERYLGLLTSRRLRVPGRTPPATKRKKRG